MPKSKTAFKRILVVSHPQLPEAIEVMEQIVFYLKEYGVPTAQGLIYDEALRSKIDNGHFDLMIALGGDGTMLRAGRLCAPIGIPILGINLGRFGFLTEVKQQQWRETFPRLFAGDYWLEKRMMLHAELWRSTRLLSSWEVLNEIVVSRGHMVRPIHLEASVDGRELTTYVADALIAATATGSTAYALAAGGPILSPELRNILLVAVAPHLSIDRAIVLAEGSSVSITVNTAHQAVLSPDGLPPINLEDGDRVDAFAGKDTVQFLRFQDPGYFYRNLTPHMSQHPSASLTGNQR
jgi:NAD+ kinase